MLRSVNFTAVVILLRAFYGLAYAQADPWLVTANEMEIAYKYQVNFGQRLLHPLNPANCLYNNGEVVASYRGKQILVPCRFINETTRHLKELVQTGAAKYFFPLDVDRADLAVPVELWESKYSRVPLDEILPALLSEKSLMAVYRTAAHLSIVNPQNGDIDPVAKAWKEKSHFLAFYNGRPATISPPQPEGRGMIEPQGYRTAASVYFVAHRLGELVFMVDERVFVLDLSFDHVTRGNPDQLGTEILGSITHRR
jgi:hypothetical protein